MDSSIVGARSSSILLFPYAVSQSSLPLQPFVNVFGSSLRSRLFRAAHARQAHESEQLWLKLCLACSVWYLGPHRSPGISGRRSLAIVRGIPAFAIHVMYLWDRLGVWFPVDVFVVAGSATPPSFLPPFWVWAPYQEAISLGWNSELMEESRKRGFSKKKRFFEEKRFSAVPLVHSSTSRLPAPGTDVRRAPAVRYRFPTDDQGVYQAAREMAR